MSVLLYGNDFLCRVLPIVVKLLDSSEVSLRIAAGEAVALLYELARGNDQVESILKLAIV